MLVLLTVLVLGHVGELVEHLLVALAVGVVVQTRKLFHSFIVDQHLVFLLCRGDLLPVVHSLQLKGKDVEVPFHSQGSHVHVFAHA